MYGLVNQALEDYVRRGFGESAWTRVRDGAGIDLEMFVAMDSYPDDLTYRLVHSATEALGIDAARVLEEFGEHWVLYTVQEGYGELLSMFGSDLRTFLPHLDNLHSHVGLTFPQLRPPSFAVQSVGDGGGDSLLLHYRSQRAGLAPMVIGLIKGLGKRFSQDIRVHQLDRRSDEDHDTFRIDFVSPAQAQ
jgi:hypothetical protein